jgi:hypothetical protein
MKKAKLVLASFMVRVIVDENATDDEIIKESRSKFLDVLNDDCIGDNIESIEDDEECPAIGYELL